ncbi:holo-ACP synthase [uncultured Gemmiger sp.]|uniref:holo-ACP synthase n=1 Tax=uncultured Gemmiger sp. TaxID=1623490 RepID=UPI0025E3F230|nr:holo-ACP synthase [uncultured Gemmiger sp.]
MILGIGTDLCQVDRIARSLARQNFVAHVFSEEEQHLLNSRQGKARAETAAANFAAKEAFLKACGTGLAGFALAEVAVLRRPTGAPCYQLGGRAEEWARRNHVTAHLSLTHEAGLACAFVVLEAPDAQGGDC